MWVALTLGLALSAGRRRLTLCGQSRLIILLVLGLVSVLVDRVLILGTVRVVRHVPVRLLDELKLILVGRAVFVRHLLVILVFGRHISQFEF